MVAHLRNSQPPREPREAPPAERARPPGDHDDAIEAWYPRKSAGEILRENVSDLRHSWVDYLVVGLGVAVSLWLVVFVFTNDQHVRLSTTADGTIAVVLWSITLMCALLFGVASLVLDDWRQPTRAWARAWWVFAAGAAFSALLKAGFFPEGHWVKHAEVPLKSLFSTANNGFFLHAALLFLGERGGQRRWRVALALTCATFLTTLVLWWAQVKYDWPRWSSTVPDIALSVGALVLLVAGHYRSLVRIVAHSDDPFVRSIVRWFGGAWLFTGYAGYAGLQVVIPFGWLDPVLQSRFRVVTPAVLSAFASGVPLLFLVLRYVERSSARSIQLRNWIRQLPIPAFIEDLQGRTIASSKAERELLGYSERALEALETRDALWADPEVIRKARASARTSGYAQTPATLRRIGGEKVAVDLAIFPRSGDSELIGLYLDVSARGEAEALAELHRRLAAEAGVNALLHALAQGLMQVFNARGACVLLITPDGGDLIPMSRTGGWEPQAYEVGVTLARFRGEGRTLDVSWYRHTERACPLCGGGSAVSTAPEGCLLLPLKIGDEALGAVWIRDPRLPPTDEERRARVAQFTAAVATLVMRAERVELGALVEEIRDFDPRSTATVIDGILARMLGGLFERVRVKRWALLVDQREPGRHFLRVAAHDGAAAPRLATRLTGSHEAWTGEGSERGEVVAQGADAARALTERFFDDPTASASALALSLRTARGETDGVLVLIDRLSAEGAPVAFTRLDLHIARQYVALCEMVLQSMALNRRILMDWYWAVHELSNPLMGIRGGAQYARKLVDAGDKVQALRRLDAITLDATLMKRVIDQFEALDSEAPIVRERRPVRLVGDLLLPVREEVLPFLRMRRFSIEDIRIEESARLPRLLLDPEAMKAALLNLLRNAIKYADPKPSRFLVTIGAHRTDDDGVCIFVRDQGIGVPEDFAEKIFTRGQRAPNAVECGTVGLGLGLVVVRRVLREHGGDARLIHSANPTEFGLFLPRDAIVPDDISRRDAVTS